MPQTLNSVLGILPGILGLACAAFVWFAAQRRYRRVNVVLLTDASRSLLPDGALLAVVASVTTALGIAGIAVVLLQALV